MLLQKLRETAEWAFRSVMQKRAESRIARLACQGEFSRLLATAEEGDTYIASLVRDNLREIANISAVYIKRALSSRHSELRLWAVHRLKCIAPSIEAVDILTGLLKDQDQDVRHEAATILGHKGHGRALNYHRQALQHHLARPPLPSRHHTQLWRYRDSVGALAVHPIAADIPLFIHTLGDPDHEIQRASLQALENFDSPLVADAIMGAFAGSKFRETKELAVKALGKYGHSPIVAEFLVAQLETSVDGLRELLVRIGAPVIEPLISLVQQRPISHSLLLSAAAVLNEVGDPSSAAPLAAALKTALEEPEPGDMWSKYIISALGKTGDPSVAMTLVEIMKTRPRDAQVAATAFVEVADSAAVLALCENLQSGHLTAPRIAIEALCEIRDPRAVVPLSECLIRQNRHGEQIAETCVSALGKIGHPSAIDALCGVMGNSSALVRQSAAEALGKIGGTKATRAWR